MLSYQGVMWPLCYRAFDQSRRSGGSSLFMLNISIIFHIISLFTWELEKYSSSLLHLNIQPEYISRLLSFNLCWKSCHFGSRSLTELYCHMVTRFDVNQKFKSWRGPGCGGGSTRQKEQEVEHHKKRNLQETWGSDRTSLIYIPS